MPRSISIIIEYSYTDAKIKTLEAMQTSILQSTRPTSTFASTSSIHQEPFLPGA